MSSVMLVVVTFGDDEPDDAFDPSEGPDPEQVARRLHEWRRERDADLPRWVDLDLEEQTFLIGLIVRLFVRLRLEGTLR